MSICKDLAPTLPQPRWMGDIISHVHPTFYSPQNLECKPQWMGDPINMCHFHTITCIPSTPGSYSQV